MPIIEENTVQLALKKQYKDQNERNATNYFGDLAGLLCSLMAVRHPGVVKTLVQIRPKHFLCISTGNVFCIYLIFVLILITSGVFQ